MTIKAQSNNWKISWQLVTVLLVISFGGAGFMATKALLKLPDNANCNNISLRFKSATNRIYCAQLIAEKNTVEDLLTAITLLDGFRENHPLAHEFNRYMKDWSNDILALAQQDLDQGKLESAIVIARKIPQNAENKDIIEEKVNRWREIWEKGNAIEAQINSELKQAQWNEAFLVAVKLLNIDNSYWKETRYREIVNTIDLAKEENKTLENAYLTLEKGGLDNFLETITIASQIPESSYSYEEAQELITQAEDELLEIANQFLDEQNWQELSRLANNISTNSRLHPQAMDWNTLARAGQNVDLSTVSGVELAIAEAEQISSDSAIYFQAQALIKDWLVQKEDIAYLASARSLARSGEIADLNAAIAKAELVARGNTLYPEAQKEILSWQREIQIIEDSPLLTQARELAGSNTVDGWQNAIIQASRIGYNRALYPEAKELIQKWQRSIQTVEDRPILDKAVALGNSGKYQQAINTAININRGRALYTEAQTNIRKWRMEINAQRNLSTAYRIARSNNEQSLLRAINLARRIPRTSSVGYQSSQAINTWSAQMLNKAQRLADSYSIPDLEKAIKIAGMIPRGNSTYTRAQNRINQWKKRLYPSLNTQTPIQETNFSN